MARDYFKNEIDEGIEEYENGYEDAYASQSSAAPDFSWQSHAEREIKDKSAVILSSPTGTGKTKVFMDWALDKGTDRIYITAPIKALSNQRYRELLASGMNVKIETGDMTSDFSRPGGKPEIICCTQEIYTNHHADDRNATLIMDEFHYIFENSDRARAYIDGLVNSQAENILLSSATFGNTEMMEDYARRVTRRDFITYENTRRATDLEYNTEEILPQDIHNALVVAFSAKWCYQNAETVAASRPWLDDGQLEKMENLAERFDLDPDDIPYEMGHGVAVYVGAMLPKEKLFVEKCFEEGLIDTVCGTDALALGVNFPVESVIFTQLDKYYEGQISKNAFDQLAGRAGRPGFFNIGYVGYWDSGAESYDSVLEENFEDLKTKENEEPKIELTPDYRKLVRGETTPEEEAKYIEKMSLDSGWTPTEEQIAGEVNNIITPDVDILIEKISKERGLEQKCKKLEYLNDILTETMLTFDDSEQFVSTVTVNGKEYPVNTEKIYDVDKLRQDVLASELEEYFKEQGIDVGIWKSGHHESGRYIKLTDPKRDKELLNITTSGTISVNNSRCSDDIIEAFSQDILKQVKTGYVKILNELEEERNKILNDIKGKSRVFKGYSQVIRETYSNEMSPSFNKDAALAIVTSGFDGIQELYGEFMEDSENIRDMLQFAKWYGQIPKEIKKEYDLPTRNVFREKVAEIDRTAVDAGVIAEMMGESVKGKSRSQKSLCDMPLSEQIEAVLEAVRKSQTSREALVKALVNARDEVKAQEKGTEQTKGEEPKTFLGDIERVHKEMGVKDNIASMSKAREDKNKEDKVDPNDD